MREKYEDDLVMLGEIFGDSEFHGMSEMEALKEFKEDIDKLKAKYTKEERLELLREMVKEEARFKADEIIALGKKIGWPRINIVRTIIA